jgi:beta-glucosidase
MSFGPVHAGLVQKAAPPAFGGPSCRARPSAGHPLGRTYDGFLENPQLVQELGEAAVRGFPGPDVANPLSVPACARHYVGDGGTACGTSTLRAKLLEPAAARVVEVTLRRIRLPG